MRKLTAAAAVASLVPVLFAATSASAEVRDDDADRDAWRFRAAIYGWFPDARAHATLPLPGGGNAALDADPGRYLSKLEFAFMGTLEARKGRWSVTGDAIHVDFGNTQQGVARVHGPQGPVDLPVPVDLHLDLAAFVGTLEVGYAFVDLPHAQVDGAAGVRYLHLTTALDAQVAQAPPGVPAEARRSMQQDYWDGVVAVRGRSELPGHGFASYYADVGTGTSRLTWQAFAGVGYRFPWGDALVGYRYLAYDFKDAAALSDLRLSGPLVGVAMRF